MPSRRPVRRTLGAGVLGLVTTAALLVTATPALAAPGYTGTVTGTVTRATDDTALAGARVTAETPQGTVLASTTTAADGTYTLTGVPSGPRVVCADGTSVVSDDATAGWLRDCAYATPVPVGRGTVTTGIDRTLRIGSAVEGVVSEPSGAPLAGVVVVLDSDLPTPTTGPDGRWRVVFDPTQVSYLAPFYRGGAATGPASAVGYLDASQRFAAGHYSIEVRPGRTYTLKQTLQPASRLSGRVTGPDGTGLGGVQVSSGWSSPATTTAADGTWTLAPLPSRRQVYLAFTVDRTTTGSSPTGYLSQCWRTVVQRYPSDCQYVDGATALTTPTGSTRAGLDVRLHAAGGITGQVTDSLGRPVPYAQVTTYGGDRILTDSDGVYRSTGLSPNPYYRVCTDTEYQSGGRPFPNPDGYIDACWTDDDDDPTSGSPITVAEGQLVTGKDIVLQGLGGIGGVVLRPDGTPADDISVEVTARGPNGSQSTLTQSGGAFRLTGLRVGTYTVCFASSHYDPNPAGAPYGYARTCSDTTVSDSTVSVLPTLTTSPGGRISGLLTDVYGFAIGPAFISVRDARTGAEVTTVQTYGYDPSGAWSVDGLAPGRYTVCFTGDYASRRVDNFTPPNGYVPLCWKRRGPDSTPMPVVVTAGTATTGVDGALRVDHS